MNYDERVNYQIRLEDAEVFYHDFRGAPSKFNPKGGRRTVSVELANPMIRNRRVDDDFYSVPVEKLIDDGWNVKTLRKREGEEDTPDRHYLECVIAFPRDEDERRGPKVYVVNSGDRDDNGRLRANLLSEESIGVLDYAKILRVDIDINPYNWEVKGEKGVTAYVDKLYVVIEKSPYDDKYASEEYPEE